MAELLFKDVVKVYPNGVKAVQELNLKIKDKEFIVLVGPSGCGKTTTLRMVAGLEEISSGELYIDDKFVNDVAPKDRDIAMVFQNYALYPHMNVRDNMAFGLKLRKTPKAEIERRVKEASEILGIEHLLDRKPKALSGGQRQRVAMGRAIVREPRVFLMDEPLSNLDAKLRVQMRTEIAKLHNKLKTTFIYVTHDQTEAMTLGTRIVVMHEGFVQQVDSPQNLYNNPCNRFVAEFIGSPQMNMINAKADKAGDAVALSFEGYKITLNAEKSKNIIDKGFVGKEVLMGIRPEDMYDAPDMIAANPDSIVNMNVELVELLGAETYLYLLLGEDNNFTARVDPTSKAVKDTKIKIAIDANKIHCFDLDTGLTITN